ncbi:hypothetical protein HCH15_05915 [Corynebacterium testudinoris]|uniref:Uncharacterized protein n=1 Tax=Corynebacterium testudinoris TaxID=136857 RepID=A0A0G3H4F4_9CORY|nr:hypothetical protein [Corynebacterium testudinoris]AKK08276.1 hypothetical protein CTEST_04135 [Corynebacterium testudinoris]MBX8995717.1 hypothetical protein [Corynebacterium testudinoris]
MPDPDTIVTLRDMFDTYFGTSDRASSTMTWLPDLARYLWDDTVELYRWWLFTPLDR